MWKPNETKPITVIAAEGTEHKAYYKLRGSSDAFVEISGEWSYKGDMIHELPCSFDEGEYIIRTNNMSEGGVSFTDLVVAQSTSDSVCECVSTGTNTIDTKVEQLNSTTNQLLGALSDKLIETQEIIELDNNMGKLII